MNQQTLERPSATGRRLGVSLAALAAVAALTLGAGAGAAHAASGHATGQYDAWEVEIVGGQLEVGTHAHAGGAWSAGDWLVTDNDGIIWSPDDDPDTVLELGFSTEEVYDGTGYAGSITFAITGASYDSGAGAVPTTDIVVSDAGGTLFDLGAADSAETFSSGNQHDHWTWQLGSGSGTYTVTVVASASSTYASSDPYTITIVVP